MTRTTKTLSARSRTPLSDGTVNGRPISTSVKTSRKIASSSSRVTSGTMRTPFLPFALQTTRAASASASLSRAARRAPTLPTLSNSAVLAPRSQIHPSTSITPRDSHLQRDPRTRLPISKGHRRGVRLLPRHLRNLSRLLAPRTAAAAAVVVEEAQEEEEICHLQVMSGIAATALVPLIKLRQCRIITSLLRVRLLCRKWQHCRWHRMNQRPAP